jgi:hypothetical protein
MVMLFNSRWSYLQAGLEYGADGIYMEHATPDSGCNLHWAADLYMKVYKNTHCCWETADGVVEVA